MYDFDWNTWLPFFIVLFTWIVCVAFAERRKDVVFALISEFFAIILMLNAQSSLVYAINITPVTGIFPLISIYEFVILAMKYKSK